MCVCLCVCRWVGGCGCVWVGGCVCVCVCHVCRFCFATVILNVKKMLFQVSGRIVTGQNPASATGTAEAVVKLLS